MTGSEVERVAILETQMADVQMDVREIKDAVKNLERIAQTGNGAFRTILYLGALLGYLSSVLVIMSKFFTHSN